MEMRTRKVGKVRAWGFLRGAIRSMSSKMWVLVVLALLGTVLFEASHVFAQAEDDAENRLKLAYLRNFAMFTEWPGDVLQPGARLTICVAGNNPFKGELEKALNERSVRGHTVGIRKLRPSDDP